MIVFLSAVVLILAGTLLARILRGQEPVALPEISVSPAAETAAPTPSPTPEPTPEPTPSPAPTPEPVYEVTLTQADEETLQALLAHPELRHITATACTDYAALAALQRALPDCYVEYAVPLGALTVDSRETALTLDADSGVKAAELQEKLAWLPRLEKLDLLALDWGNAAIGPLVEAYPELDILWTVRFSGKAVRSDITCFSTLQPWPVKYRQTDSDLYPLLHYCKHLVALDIGHNDIRDLGPVGELKELKVLIIGDNPYLTDLSPLSKLDKLEYLELFLADRITDFSPLAALTNMVDLCVGYCDGLNDISFIDNMPRLEMGWFANSHLTDEQRQAAQDSHPDTTFLFFPSRVSSTSDGWRMTDRNVAIRKAFVNWRNVIAFRAWNDVEYREGVELYETYPIDL